MSKDLVKKENVRIMPPTIGTTDKNVAAVLLSPKASKQEKDSAISQWLFERGKDNASFIAELFVSKGTHLKETQAFKRQIRFDFENFATSISLLFSDMADEIMHDFPEAMIVPKGADRKVYFAIGRLGHRLKLGADLINKQRESITLGRMREKGFGTYIDKGGKTYSIFDKDIEEVVKKDREDAIKEFNE